MLIAGSIQMPHFRLESPFGATVVAVIDNEAGMSAVYTPSLLARPMSVRLLKLYSPPDGASTWCLIKGSFVYISKNKFKEACCLIYVISLL